ncbi:hypothetical protein FOD82_08550 [Lactobacillus sp. LL6]|nr:hypothetical protein FOD82_08550 [Lactobacillus sp. LL6]
MIKLIHNLLTKNSKYTNLGLAMLLMGLDLWSEPDYFFWPPQYAFLMNDNGIDGIAVIVGIGLLVYAGMNIHDNQVAGILLGISAAFVTMITGIEIMHMIFAGQLRMGIPAILGFYMVLNILQIARDRNTKR